MASTSHAPHVEPRHQDGSRRVVRHGRASTTSSIAAALVVKHGQLFFLCGRDGDVPFDQSNGLGLYYHDCRYLNGYELRLGGARADPLAASAAPGFWATLELTNGDIETAGGQLLEKEQIGIKWERTLDPDECALKDTIALTNFGVTRASIPLTVRLRAEFESIFVVRGAQAKKRGTLHDPHWDGGTLRFEYDGADDVRRELHATFDPAPEHTSGTTAEYTIAVDPHQTVILSVSLHVVETEDGQADVPRATRGDVERTRQTVQRASDEWVAGAARVQCDDEPLNRVFDRSLRDLHLLATALRGRRYFAAGVPWFVTLFGRDSLIASLESLAYLPDRAEDTVRLLASYQGTRHDDWRDEAPGKIMHELRVGEMAHLDEIPQTPYYGSVDATPLFLILIAQHAAWTGRLDLFRDVKPHVEAALHWIDDTIAAGGSGFLAYATSSKNGLSNQGWKDSGDSIVNHDGSLATPPIALVEVQGYVYLAKHGIADLYRRDGDDLTADRLIAEADALRERFERQFWIDELGTYALALQKNNEPAGVVASNPGQALWTGIASPDRGRKTASRLMQADMFSGWGIRTLSAHERRYNPIGYHDGTVWPHDNAIVVAGCRRYGCLESLARVVSGIVAAAMQFDHDRLPEVFAGFDRREYSMPVHYPVACHPQAWAAGAVPFMLQSALGLEPDAFERRLRVTRPVLPENVRTLTVDRLRVGDAAVHLVFARGRNNEITIGDVKVTGGKLDVRVED